MWQVVRVLVALAATVMVVAGLTMIAAGLRLEGLYLAGIGVVGLVIVILERQRYRSVAEDEPARAPNLRPTDEVFTDPTTGHRTRVWIDPQTGERSYRPE